MAILQRETTEFIYIGVTGTVPAAGELAFLAAGTRPQAQDWLTAILIEDDQDPLWADAQASGAAGDYFLAMLIGDYDGGSQPAENTTLAPGDYQVWVRLTGAVERPVRIAPIALEVQ